MTQPTAMGELEVARQYDVGREDGIHAGIADRDWRSDRIDQVVEELRREVREAALSLGRLSRAYALGYARGYREAAL